jgi:hypothetical protein
LECDVEIAGAAARPAPTAGPRIADTIGFSQEIMLRTRSRDSFRTRDRTVSSSTIRWSISKSPPAENASPRPLSNVALMSWSASMRGQIRAS